MKKTLIAAVILIVAALFIGGVSADTSVGGDQGKIIIKSNAEGATVNLFSVNGDMAYSGIIQNGQAVIYVYSTGTPVSKAIVYGDGYEPAAANIDGNPAAGQVDSYTIDLERIPTGMIGGSFGFIQVVTNVVGAKVELHAVGSKVIADGVTDNQGIATFEVYTTATPASYVYVSAPGWESKSVSVVPPEPGKTNVVNVVLKSTSAPEVDPTEPDTPEPAPSPMGAALGVLGVLGAAFLLRKE